jgi:hypothetical protein
VNNGKDGAEGGGKPRHPFDAIPKCSTLSHARMIGDFVGVGIKEQRIPRIRGGVRRLKRWRQRIFMARRWK